jgi:hypothetical protein
MLADKEDVLLGKQDFLKGPSPVPPWAQEEAKGKSGEAVFMVVVVFSHSASSELSNQFIYTFITGSKPYIDVASLHFWFKLSVGGFPQFIANIHRWLDGHMPDGRSVQEHHSSWDSILETKEVGQECWPVP